MCIQTRPPTDDTWDEIEWDCRRCDATIIPVERPWGGDVQCWKCGAIMTTEFEQLSPDSLSFTLGWPKDDQ